MAHGDFNEYLEKPLPSSAESERAVLGAILLDDKVLTQAIEQLKPEHFYSPFHRKVYAAMTALFQRQEKIDPILIGEEIKKDSSIESFGGIAAITNLTYGVPYFTDISAYVKTVRDKSRLRELVKVCGQISSTALAEDETPEIVLNYAQSAVNEVCTQDDKRGFSSIGDLSAAQLVKTAQYKEKGITHTGLQTGFKDLDEKTGGLQKTDLIVVAARPGMGKSSLVVNIAENVSHLEPKAVTAIFSLEMSKEQYTDRMLCSSAEVDLTRYRTGYLSNSEMDDLIEAQNRFDEYNIKIDDSSQLSPLEMRSKLMRLKAETKRLDLVIVDYLQRMSSSQRAESRQQEVSRIARELKSIAKDLEVPVIAVSSLSRGPETRPNKRPLMSDLRESGDIESEADVVAFIFREEYYTPDNVEFQGVAEFIIGKHRHGPTGTVKMAFMKEYTKFANYYS